MVQEDVKDFVQVNYHIMFLNVNAQLDHQLIQFYNLLMPKNKNKPENLNDLLISNKYLLKVS